MKIEALVRWTEISKVAPEADELSRILNYSPEQDQPKIQVKYEYSPMTFELSDVVRFNKGYTTDLTTLRFSDGDTFMVKINYDQFKDLWEEYMGERILVVIDTSTEPEPKENADDDEEYDV